MTQMPVHLRTGKETAQRPKQGSRVAASLFNGPVSLTAPAPAKARGEAHTGRAGSEPLFEGFHKPRRVESNVSEKAECADTKDVQEDCQKRLSATGTGRDKGKVLDQSLRSTTYADTHQVPNPALHRLL